jgi:hypothetical protein
MTSTIQLIGYGTAPAITADELKVGDVTIWNYGSTEAICGIIPKGNQSLVLHIACKSGFYKRTIRRTSLVAVARKA